MSPFSLAKASLLKSHQILSGRSSRQERTHTNDQHPQLMRQGSFRYAEEPKPVSAKDLEADDIVIAYVVNVLLVKCLTRYLKVSWVQQVPERAR